MGATDFVTDAEHTHGSSFQVSRAIYAYRLRPRFLLTQYMLLVCVPGRFKEMAQPSGRT